MISFRAHQPSTSISHQKTSDAISRDSSSQLLLLRPCSSVQLASHQIPPQLAQSRSTPPPITQTTTPSHPRCLRLRRHRNTNSPKTASYAISAAYAPLASILDERDVSDDDDNPSTKDDINGGSQGKTVKEGLTTCNNDEVKVGEMERRGRRVTVKELKSWENGQREGSEMEMEMESDSDGDDCDYAATPLRSGIVQKRGMMSSKGKRKKVYSGGGKHGTRKQRKREERLDKGDLEVIAQAGVDEGVTERERQWKGIAARKKLQGLMGEK